MTIRQFLKVPHSMTLSSKSHISGIIHTVLSSSTLQECQMLMTEPLIMQITELTAMLVNGSQQPREPDRNILNHHPDK